METYNVKSIRDIPMGDVEFRTVESLEHYFKTDLASQEGMYFYRRNGLSKPKGALVLFRYKSKIRAFGIIKYSLNKNNKYDLFKTLRSKYVKSSERKLYHGAFQVNINSVNWLDTPIEKYEMNLLEGCSQVMFSQAPNEYSMDCLEQLLILLNSRIDSKNIIDFTVGNKLKIRRRTPADKRNPKTTIRKPIPETKIYFLHENMKNFLLEKLSEDYNEKCIDSEKDFIDVLVTKPNLNLLYEIKTDETANKCIRNALGQLLYYEWTQLIANSNKNFKLIVYGLYKIDNTGKEFLDHINNKIKVEYKSLEEEIGIKKLIKFISKNKPKTK